MMDQRAAGRYARALFGLALERGELEPVDKSLGEVSGLLERHPEIAHLVLNSTIGLGEKEDFLDKILPENIPVLTLHFLKLLVKKNRFAEFRAVQDIFHRLVEHEQGVQRVLALTPATLSESTQDRLKKVMEKKLGCKVVLTMELDETMMGGLILRFGGQEIDASFKNRLTEIKQALIGA